MGRKLVIPGRVLTPAEKMKRYRERPKNKIKINEYEKNDRRVNAKMLRDMMIRKKRQKVVFKGSFCFGSFCEGSDHKVGFVFVRKHLRIGALLTN